MLDEFVNSLYATSGAPAVLVGIIALALGVLECFFGYRIFKVQVGIVGFIAGLGIGLAALGGVGIAWLAIVVGILIGVLLGIISMRIYKVGVFLVVAFFAFIITGLFAHNAWLALIIAVAVGLLGVFLTRPVIIAVTAVGGAGIAADAISRLLFGLQPPAWWNWAGLAALVVLAVCGITAQLRTTKDMAAKT